MKFYLYHNTYHRNTKHCNALLSNIMPPYLRNTRKKISKKTQISKWQMTDWYKRSFLSQRHLLMSLPFGPKPMDKYWNITTFHCIFCPVFSQKAPSRSRILWHTQVNKAFILYKPSFHDSPSTLNFIPSNTVYIPDTLTLLRLLTIIYLFITSYHWCVY